MICEICGHEYISHCRRCTLRVMAWGEQGAYEVVQMAKRKDDISANELLEFILTYYRGETKKREAMSTLKTSLKILGYEGKFIGRITLRDNTYHRLRQRENQQARRWRLRKDKCDICGSIDQLRIHHIVPLAWGGKSSIENCLTLCEVCHRKVHKKISKVLGRIKLLKYLKPHEAEIEILARSTIDL